MKSILSCILIASWIASAQTSGDIVACNLSIEGSATMKQLYGKRVPLYTGSVVGKNYSTSMVSISSVDIYLALQTVNRLPTSDASAILTKTYDHQPVQEISGAIGMAAAGVGIATAVGSPIMIGVRTLAYILFGVTFGQNALVPFLSAGQPSLSSLLANQCESMGSQGTLVLQPAGTFSCNMYIQKAGRATVLPSNIPFDLSIDAPPPAGTLPPAMPLRNARPMRAVVSKTITVNPATTMASPRSMSVPQMTGPYPQCWTAPEDGVKYCRNMNGVIFRPDLPPGTPNVLPNGASIHINPDGLAQRSELTPAIATVINQPVSIGSTPDTYDKPAVLVLNANVTSNLGEIDRNPTNQGDNLSAQQALSVHADHSTIVYGWDVGAPAKRAVTIDPADDPAHVKALAIAALPELKRKVTNEPLCGPCWRALAFAQLILSDELMAKQGFQMADDLDAPHVLKLAGAR